MLSSHRVVSYHSSTPKYVHSSNTIIAPRSDSVISTASPQQNTEGQEVGCGRRSLEALYPDFSAFYSSILLVLLSGVSYTCIISCTLFCLFSLSILLLISQTHILSVLLVETLSCLRCSILLCRLCVLRPRFNG